MQRASLVLGGACIASPCGLPAYLSPRPRRALQPSAWCGPCLLLAELLLAPATAAPARPSCASPTSPPLRLSMPAPAGGARADQPLLEPQPRGPPRFQPAGARAGGDTGQGAARRHGQAGRRGRLLHAVVSARRRRRLQSASPRGCCAAPGAASRPPARPPAAASPLPRLLQLTMMPPLAHRRPRFVPPRLSLHRTPLVTPSPPPLTPSEL